MRYRLIILSAFLIGLILFIAGIYKLYAQKTTPAMIVHPSNFELVYQNQPITETITLDNTTTEPMNIRVDLRNFTANGEEGAVTLTTEDTTYALAKWINITPQTTTIPAHRSKNFTFTITPPTNAEPGGHFGSVVFATIPSANTKGIGAALSQEVASLILLKMPGATEESAVLESFNADKNFYEFGPVTLTARVRNTGQVHIIPMGQIVVKGTFGDTYIIPIEPKNILPDATRQLSNILNHKLLLGEYTAHFVAAYGSTNKQFNTSTVFYAFPIRYGVIVLVIILVIFLLRKRLGKACKALITGK